VTTSAVALRICYEFRDHLDGSDDDVVILLRCVTPEGRLSATTSQGLPEEYRRALCASAALQLVQLVRLAGSMT
jgi:hypothetical protein